MSYALTYFAEMEMWKCRMMCGALKIICRPLIRSCHAKCTNSNKLQSAEWQRNSTKPHIDLFQNHLFTGSSTTSYPLLPSFPGARAPPPPCRRMHGPPHTCQFRPFPVRIGSMPPRWCQLGPWVPPEWPDWLLVAKGRKPTGVMKYESNPNFNARDVFPPEFCWKVGVW